MKDFLNLRLKTNVILSVLLLFLAGIVVSCGNDDDDDHIILVSDLPQPAQTFLTTHFDGLTVRKVEQKHTTSINGSLYEVVYTNGFDVEFDKNGAWTEIECEHLEVPQSILDLLPSNMLEYVAEKYPNRFIVSVKKLLTKGFELELNNDVDLYFDMNGDFIGVDR